MQLQEEEDLKAVSKVWKVADIPSRGRLRSSSTSQLMLHPPRLAIVEERSFALAGSRLWNSLLGHITAATSLPAFR